MAKLNVNPKNFLITGPPGCGKTTVLLETKNALESRGFKVGGCITTEMREKGRRVGFAIRDLVSGEEGILAHVALRSKKRVGRYAVDIVDLERVGVGALKNSLTSRVDFVVIDEIASMELFSRGFQNVVRDLLNSPKIILGSIHYRSKHKFLLEIRDRKDTEIIEIYQETRDSVPALLINKIVHLLPP